MKKMLFILLVVVILLSSCNWDLSEDNADLDNVIITTVTTTTETTEKVSTLRDGVLSKYVVRLVSDPVTRSVDQEQFYRANGTLLYSWKYGRNADGLVTTAVYYTANDALSHYYIYGYNADNIVTTQAEYNSVGALNWLRRYSTNAAGSIEVAAVFDSSQTITGALQYFYIDEQAGWNMEISYGTGSGSLAGGVTVSNPVAGPVNTDSLDVETWRDLALPAAGTLPEPLIPDPASSDLPVSGYRFSLDDEYGNTLVSLNKDFYPLSGIRKDSRLDASVRVELTYDTENRIETKSTYYGSTLALGIAIEYKGDTLYPVRVETSGKSMLLPLNYSIVYGDSNEVVSIEVYSGTTRVRSFEYSYESPVVDPPAPADIRAMDPFAFIGEVLAAGATISEYDGDGELIETFSAISNIDGLSVEVRLPNGELNGRFQIVYDDEGHCSSITAYGKDNKEVWREEISLFTDMWDDLEAAAPGVFDRAVEYGPMVETMFSGDRAATASEVQDNFVFSLLF